jgi:hypothetical protein
MGKRGQKGFLCSPMSHGVSQRVLSTMAGGQDEQVSNPF